MKDLRKGTPFLLACLSGCLLAFSFPTVLFGHLLPDASFLIWVSLLPLLFAIHNRPLWQTFGLSWLGGFAFITLSLFWIGSALYRVPQYPWWLCFLYVGAIGGLIGFFIALLFVFAGKIRQKTRIPWYILLPFCWFGFEIGMTVIPFGGFPWLQLGYTQYRHLYLIQSADLFGVSGVSLLIVLVNGLLFESLHCLLAGRRPVALKYLSGAVLLLTLNIGYGWIRLSAVNRDASSSDSVRIAAIPGDIPQQKKWDPYFQDEVLEKYRSAALSAHQAGADLIVWPEMSPPYRIPRDARGLPPNVIHSETPLLTGVQTVDPQNTKLKWNSLYLWWGETPILICFIGLLFLLLWNEGMGFAVRAKTIKQSLAGLSLLLTVLGCPFQVLGETKQVGQINASLDIERVTVSGDGKLYALDKEGNVNAGWPKDFSAENRYFSFRPRLVDIDFDLQDEVVAVSQDKNSGHLRLHVFKGNGQELQNWQWDLPDEDLVETPVIADVNHDSSLDIVYATESQHVSIYRRDFQLAKRFSLDAVPSIAIGDPDNNGLQDLFIVEGSQIKQWDPFQEELISFASPTGGEPIFSPVAFEDVNQDLYPDFIYATNANHIVAVDRNGRRLLNIVPPQGFTIASGVVVEDIDLDREPEIIVLTETQDILAFETNGTQVGNWRQPLLYRQPLPEGGIVADDIYQGLFSTVTGWDFYSIYRNKLGGYSRILLGENIHDFDTKADFQFVEAVRIGDVFAFPKLFTPNGDDVNDTVQIHYNLSDDALIALDLYDSHERFLSRLMEKAARGAGTHQETINGLDTKGTTTGKDDRPLDTGAYIIKVVAQSKEGFLTSAKVNVLVNGLKAEIESPTDGASIFGKITVSGVATDPNFGENNLDADFKAYKLYWRPGRWNISPEEAVAVGQNGSDWLPLPVPTRHQCPNDAQNEPIDAEFPNSNVSCRPVQHGVLGTFDTTALFERGTWNPSTSLRAGSERRTPNGDYTILLKTLDSNGNAIGKIHFDTAVVNVQNPLATDPHNPQDLFDRRNPNNPLYQGPKIVSANLSSRLISRENPSTTLTYTLQNETANVHVDIFPASGNDLGSAASVYSFNRQAPGSYNFVWDGKNTLGRNVDGGHYRIRITANAIDGTGVDVNESLELDVARGFSARDILAVQSFEAVPNQFNPFGFGNDLQPERATLHFALTKEAKVTIQVFNQIPEEGGTLQKTLMNEQILRAGSVTWDGTGNNGIILPAGRSYVVRLRAVGIDVGNDESVRQDILVGLVQPALDPSLSARLDRLVGDVGEEFVNDGTLNAMVGSPDFLWRARATGYVEVPFEYAISAYGEETYTSVSTNSVTQPMYRCYVSHPDASGMHLDAPCIYTGTCNDPNLDSWYNDPNYRRCFDAINNGYNGFTVRDISIANDSPVTGFDVRAEESGGYIYNSNESYDLSANTSRNFSSLSSFAQGNNVQFQYYASGVIPSSCINTGIRCPTICVWADGNVTFNNDSERQYCPRFGMPQEFCGRIADMNMLFHCGNITVTAHGSTSATRSWQSVQPTSGNLSLNSLSASLPATSLASFSASVGSGQSDAIHSWITGYNLSITNSINGYASSGSSSGSTITLPGLAAWLNGGTLAAETRDNSGNRITTFDSATHDPYTLVAPYNKIWGWHRGFNRDQFRQYTNRINFYQDGYRPYIFSGDPQRNLYTFSNVVHLTGWEVEVRYPNVTVDKLDGDNPLNISAGALNIFSLEAPHVEGPGVRGNQNANIEDYFRLKLLPEAQPKRFIEIHGSATANYELYYYDADEADPKWHAIPPRTHNAVADGLLAHWDVTRLNGKNYTVVLKTVNPANDQVNQDTFNIGIGKQVDTSQLENDEFARVDTPFKRASLLFPPHSLSQPELITINAVPRSEADFRLPGGVTPLGAIFEVKPDHIQIDPRYHVQLELTFTPEEIRETFGVSEPSELQIYNLAGDELLEGLATVIQFDNGDDADPDNDVYRFTANLEHFSQYFLARKQVGTFYITNPGSDSFLKGTVTIAGRIERNPRPVDAEETPGELAAITRLTIRAGGTIIYEGAEAAFSTPWDVSQLEGNAILLFEAENADGAVTKYELPVAIDNNAGSSVLLVNGVAVANGGVITAGPDSVIEIKSSDETAGVLSIEYAWNGAILQEYLQPFTLLFAEGTHTIAYRAIDKNGNAEELKEGLLRVEEKAEEEEADQSALTLSLSDPIVVQNSQTWITGQTRLTIVANESDLNNIRYRFGGSSYRDYVEPFDLNGYRDGLFNIEYYAVDSMGLRGDVFSRQVLLDNTAPLTEVSAQGESQKFGNVFIVTQETDILLKAADDGVQPVGLTRIEYRFNNEPWAIYREPLRISNVERRTLRLRSGQAQNVARFYYRSIDLLGNIELEQSVELRLDDVAPSVQISGMPDAISPNNDGRKDTIEFQVLATDNFSKNLFVNFVLIAPDGTRYEIWNQKPLDSTTLTWDGTWNVERSTLNEDFYTYDLQVSDAQGNLSQSQAGNLVYDITPPQVTITQSGIASFSPNGDNISDILQVAYEVSDNLSSENILTELHVESPEGFSIKEASERVNSPPAQHQFAWDGSNLANNPAFDGTYRFKVIAEDLAGNRSTPTAGEVGESLGEVFIDREAPKTKLVISQPKLKTNEKTWLGLGARISFTASDPTPASGVQQTQYQFGSSTLMGYTDPFTTPLPGIDYVLKYRSVDNVGNWENEKSLNVRLDLTPPQTEIALGEPKIGEEETTWISPVTPITITAQDPDNGGADGAGVKSIYFETPDVEDSFEYREPFSLVGLSDGLKTIYYWAKDKVENISGRELLTVSLDGTPPVTTLIVGEPKVWIEALLYVTSNTVLDFSTTTERNDLENTKYKIDEDDWLMAGPFQIPAEGNYLLSYRAQDKLWNLEPLHLQNMVVDNTPPDPLLALSQGDGERYVTRQTKISLDGNATGIGVDITEYKIDDGPWQKYDGSFGIEFLTAGNHTIYFRSKDRLGNLSPVKKFEANLIDVTITREDFAMPRTLVYLLQRFDLRADDPKPNEVLLHELLDEMRGYNKITDNLDEFIQAMRSDKFTTYIFATDSLVVNFDDENEKVIRTFKELKSRIDKGEALINMAGFAKVNGKSWQMFRENWGGGDPEAIAVMGVSSKLQSGARAFAYGNGKIVELAANAGKAAQGDNNITVKSALADLIETIRPREDQLNAGEVIDSKLTFTNSGDQAVTIDVKEIFPAGGWIETKATGGEVAISTRSYQLEIPANDKVSIDYLYRMPFEATDQKITAEIKAAWESGVKDETMLEVPYQVEADLNVLMNTVLGSTFYVLRSEKAVSLNTSVNQEKLLDDLLTTIDATPHANREAQLNLDEAVESAQLAKVVQVPEGEKKGDPNEPTEFHGETASYVTGSCQLNRGDKNVLGSGFYVPMMILLFVLRTAYYVLRSRREKNP